MSETVFSEERALKYKIRGNDSPHGKLRVYFCAHPKDHALYFARIAEEILQARPNCAIWYDDGVWSEKEKAETVSPKLSDMQLFVFPVTARFLDGENEALDAFHYAIERCIPVLPLMQEGGLEQKYAEVCGNLQFLDPNASDATAIDYFKKLNDFLSSVLLGDDEIRLIRKAFRGRIFLSYRKKDRAYAQKLMRRIHANEAFRDVAIWYDEFLIPGKNFENIIKEQLTQCDLVALAVTPHLLERGNYVLQYEYKWAREEEKAILPVEMEATDRDAMKASYEALPEIVEAEDEKALDNALTAQFPQLKKIYEAGNGAYPEHDYLIGVAYLNGVDVEVDYEKAVALITSAAESGRRRAIARLISMYRSGFGVKRDYEAAIKWQRRLVEFYRLRYEELDSALDAKTYLEEYIDLGAYLQEIFHLQEAVQMYEEAIRESERIAQRHQEIYIFHLWTKIYNELGAALMALGKRDAAEENFLKGIDRLEKLAEWAKGEIIQVELVENYRLLASSFFAKEEYEGAAKYYRKAIEKSEALLEAFRKTSFDSRPEEIAERLDHDDFYEKNHVTKDQYASIIRDVDRMSKETEMSLKYNYILSCEGLGMALFMQHDPLAAEKHILKALRYAEYSFEDLDELNALQLILSLSQQMVNLLRFRDDLAGAEEYAERALQCASALLEKTESVRSQRRVADCLRLCGELKDRHGYYVESRQYFERAIQILEKNNCVELTTASLELAQLYGYMGDSYFSEERFEEAVRYYRMLIEKMQTRKEQENTLELSLYADTLNQYVKSCLKLGLEFEANVALLEASLVRSRLFRIQNDLEKLIPLAKDLIALGNIFRKYDDLDRSSLAVQNAEEILKALAESVGDTHMRFIHVQTMAMQGDLAAAQGDIDGAEARYSEADDELAAVIRADPQVRHQEFIARFYQNAARFYFEQNDRRKLMYAKKYALRALEEIRYFAEETGRLEFSRGLIELYSLLGRICEKQGASSNLKDAISYYEKMRDTAETVFEERSEVYDRVSLAEAYLRIGSLKKGFGRRSALKKSLILLDARNGEGIDDARHAELLSEVKHALGKA